MRGERKAMNRDVSKFCERNFLFNDVDSKCFSTQPLYHKIVRGARCLNA